MRSTYQRLQIRPCTTACYALPSKTYRMWNFTMYKAGDWTVQPHVFCSLQCFSQGIKLLVHTIFTSNPFKKSAAVLFRETSSSQAIKSRNHLPIFCQLFNEVPRAFAYLVYSGQTTNSKLDSEPATATPHQFCASWASTCALQCLPGRVQLITLNWEIMTTEKTTSLQIWFLRNACARTGNAALQRRATPLFCSKDLSMADVAYVMNQSLSPTKLDPTNPISPSKYPDRHSMVNAYKRTVSS